MALFGMGKRPRHKSFDYVPRFYDKDKEELQSRLGKYKPENQGDTEAVKTRLRGGFKKTMGSTYESDMFKKSVRRSNRMVLIVTFVLIAIVLYFLLAYMPKISAMFE